MQFAVVKLEQVPLKEAFIVYSSLFPFMAVCVCMRNCFVCVGGFLVCGERRGGVQRVGLFSSLF